LGDLRERRPPGRPRRRWKDNIETDLEKEGCRRMGAGLVWLRIETGGGLT